MLIKRIIPMVIVLGALAFAGAALAEGNRIEFNGTIVNVTMPTSTDGTLMLRLMGIQIPVALTGETDIESAGDEIQLRDLKVGDFVKVSGTYSNSRIVARKIQVLDDGDGGFRLRGPITAARTTAMGTWITVLGVDVLTTADTKIEKRGPDGGFRITDLRAGLTADVRGSFDDGQLVASRLKVGVREDDAVRVDFSGRITAALANRLVIDTEGGGTAVAVITASTVVAGTPAVGLFAEVHGVLNSSLEVVASRVVIRLSRDSGERPPVSSPTEFQRKVSLTPVLPAIGIRGDASIGIERERGGLTQTFEVRLSRALPNTDYRILVEIASSIVADFGTVRTNGDGSGAIRFSSSPSGTARDIRPLLPAGTTSREFTGVRVVQGGTEVLRGRF